MPNLTSTDAPLLPRRRLPHNPPLRLKPRINRLAAATAIRLRTPTPGTASPPPVPRDPPAPSLAQFRIQYLPVAVVEHSPALQTLQMPDTKAPLAEIAEGVHALPVDFPVVDLVALVGLIPGRRAS